MQKVTLIRAASLAALLAASGTGLAFAQSDAQPAESTTESVTESRGGNGFFDFEAIDADKDGKLTIDEVNTWRAAKLAELDANGDGRISEDEFIAPMMKAAEARSRARAQKMMQRMDADNDGIVTIEEMAAHRPGEAMFNRADQNGDGVLSQEETEAARQNFRNKMRGHDGMMHGHDGHRGWGDSRN